MKVKLATKPCLNNYRYGTTVTSTITPFCYKVAVPVGAETLTTALSDVEDCSAKRKKRSTIEHKPFIKTFGEDIVFPSRFEKYKMLTTLP